MIRVTSAKRAFKGSCGHKIDQGSRVVIIDRPHFLCNSCGKQDVEKFIKELRDQLK